LSIFVYRADLPPGRIRSLVTARSYLGEAGDTPDTPMDKSKLLDDVSYSDPEPLLLRPAEAARLLAISPRKLWELTNARELPVLRIGRALRYPTGELRAWVAERRDRRS